MNTSPDTIPDPSFNAVNELMSRVDTINAKEAVDLTDSDITTLVAYYRRQRARKAAGDKPTRAKGTSRTAMPLADLLNLSPTKPKPALPAPGSGSGLIRRF